ncbi:DUF6176 family protein [Paeniglutamicibacter antarcticus]|uniref:DUF6176 family protein n=1 Tax=Paeniglutamicibacter antarcticus TaxID=494023 RepID=UPI0031EB777D
MNTLTGPTTLYCFSIAGEGGTDVRASRHWLDAKHLQSRRACIDDSYEHVDLAPRVSMMPGRIRTELQIAEQETAT